MAQPFTKAFDELVEQELQKKHVPGLSIAVLDGAATHVKVGRVVNVLM